MLELHELNIWESICEVFFLLSTEMNRELASMVREAAEGLRSQLQAWRRHLHRMPETGMDTDRTQEFVRGELEKMGYVTQKCGRAGLTALAGKEGGKVYLLRADMDALPLTEESGEEFSSENPGKMHACGHDMHTAMLLGAAKILKEHEELLEGQVKFMFESGEESDNGAEDMIAGGVLEDPKVDAAQMLHVATGVPMPAGRVLIPPEGAATTASCTYRVTVTGKGGHAAMPQFCNDPIAAICRIRCGLEEIDLSEAGGGDTVIAVGQIHGGDAHNVIPDKVMMEGTIRTKDTDLMDLARERICRVAEDTGKAYKTQAQVDFIKFIPAMMVNGELLESTAGYLSELLGDDAVRIPPGMQGGGSEDFASVSIRVPSVTFILVSGNSEEGFIHPAHHPGARFDESSLPVGTSMHVYNAIRWLEEHK